MNEVFSYTKPKDWKQIGTNKYLMPHKDIIYIYGWTFVIIPVRTKFSY
jgi:hypothetical protein